MSEPILPLAIVRATNGDTFCRIDDEELGWNWRRFGGVLRYHWDEITHFGEEEPTVLFAGVSE